MPVEKIELAKVTTKVIQPIDIVIAHFFRFVKFFGFSGSSGESKATTSLG